MTREVIFNVGQKVMHIGNKPLKSKIFVVDSIKKFGDDVRLWYVFFDDTEDVFMIPETVLVEAE